MTNDDQDLHKSAADSQTHFSAILTPYRSLSPNGFIILMCLLGGVNFIAGVFFIMVGAWPVVFFLGLDVLLVYLAFRLSFRSGREYETVELVGDHLIVMRFSPAGKPEQWRFNPYWARLRLEETRRDSRKMVLSCHDNSLEFGKFLLEHEKQDFAEALNDALFEYRGGTRI